MAEPVEPTEEPAAAGSAPAQGTVLEVLVAFTRLGLTSFGGPVAHLGYFQRELVERRGWVSPSTYADLVALCQFLPGPASSQIGMALGIERAGLLGGIAAWVGFTLPSALALVLFALGVDALDPSLARGFIHGLVIVAVPVVALAVHGMAQKLCPDARRASLAVAAAIAALTLDEALAQVGILLVAGLLGWAWLPRDEGGPAAATPSPVRAWQGVLSLTVFFTLLVALPAAKEAFALPALDVADRFYRVGSLVFGDGHVVLPLLEHEVVTPGWTTSERFLAGYGAAQAVPGPLFSLSAYLGFVLDTTPTGAAGAALALVAIFLPSYLLVVGVLPFWARLRASAHAQGALRGANAAVVGLLVAALYDPVWTVAIRERADFAIGLAAFVALSVWRAPPWLVVALGALARGLLYELG